MRAWREADTLILQVEDNGPGMDESVSPPGTGVGLTNTAGRLRGLYGEDQSLMLGNAPRGGLRVAIRLPFRLEPLHEPAPEEAWTVSAS